LWQVPRQIKGSEETFKVTVTLDSQELYGRIESARQIVVRP
jgi:hypothetical protein